MAIFSNGGQSFKSDGKSMLIVFIGAIIAVTFIAAIGNQVFLSTDDNFLNNNLTLTLGSTANSTVDIEGRQLLVLNEIYNATAAGAGLATIPEGVGIQTGTGSDGLLSVQALINDTGIDAGHASTTINVSYTFTPDGNVGSAGAVSITKLITVFAALAIMIFVIVVFIKNGALGTLMGRK